MSTWVGRPAAEIARAVRDGSADPVAVVAEHLARIEALDHRVGAFVRVRAAAARDEAAAVAGRADLSRLPLAGVPIAVKDNVAVAGEPTRFGTGLLGDRPAPADHEVVRRLRDAGAVVVGITRMPELGVWATSEDADGAARNPWRLDLTAGGSSGGSAAAVASGMVPVAHGNDGLGSIRIPAAACGLVGIKPGAGVVPSGVGRTSWRGLAENGPLATTVQDAALVLSVMAGRPDLADPDTVAAQPGQICVAVSARCPLPGVRADRQTIRALLAAAAGLRRAGHTMVRADPPYSQATANAIVAWYAASTADETASLDESQLEPRQRRHAQLGRALDRLGRVRQRDRDRWKEELTVWFAAHQVALMPVTTGPPPAATGWRDRSWAANFWGNARWAPFTAAWNFGECPAATVPMGMHSAGVPIGVQIVAGPGGEALVLDIARQLEAARPWPRHAPLAEEAAPGT